MTNDIRSVFDTITPDNIKSIPVIQDAMDIFISTLEELSKESIDIKNVFTNDLIREELVKIYLDDLYRVFKTIQFNQKVIEKIDTVNNFYGIEYYKRDAIYNITKYINDEHFLAMKAFKERKGTAQAIQYIYDLVGTKILSEETSMPFTLTENDVFNFSVQGSLPREFYEAIIRPLANPLGFIYTYDQIISLVLEDLFLSGGAIYTVHDLEVRCLKSDGTTYTTDYKYYYDEFGQVILEGGLPKPRVVVNVIVLQDGQTRTKNIIFDDGTYLSQVTTLTGQTNVFYMSADDVILIPYTDQCSVYFNYDYDLLTNVDDQLITAIQPVPFDYVARLNPLNNTGLPLADQGFNNYRDVDGNYLFGGDVGVLGRQENYFAPSNIANLKLLEGKFEVDVPIYDPDTLEYVETQHIKYNDVINPAYQSVERVNTEATYIDQNLGNEDHFAQEHIIENDSVLATKNQASLESINYTPWYTIGQTDVFMGTPDVWNNPYVINSNFWPWFGIGLEPPDTFIGTSNFVIGDGDYNYKYNTVNGYNDIRVYETAYVDADPVNISSISDVFGNITFSSMNDDVPAYDDGNELPPNTQTDSFSVGAYLGTSLVLDDNTSIYEYYNNVDSLLSKYPTTAWYDTLPISMYQDNIGTLPINTVEQTIGLQLDHTANGFLDTKGVYLPGTVGSYLSTPDSVAASITGDIDIRVKVALDDWSPATVQSLLSKSDSGGTQRSYFLQLTTSSLLQMGMAPNGTGASLVTVVSTANLSATPNYTTMWVRVTRAVVGGVVKFYTSSDGINWTQLGNDAALSSGNNLFDGTAVTTIGAGDGGIANATSGKVYAAQVYNGINGTLAVNYKGSDYITGTTLVSSSTGETWTLVGSAYIAKDDYAKPNQITNWGFDTDLSGWVNGVNMPASGTAIWNAGKLRITNTSATVSYTTPILTEIGKMYKVNAKTTFISGTGNASIYKSDAQANITSNPVSYGLVNATSGNLEIYFVATASTTYIHCVVGNTIGTTYDFDNVLVVELIEDGYNLKEELIKNGLFINDTSNWTADAPSTLEWLGSGQLKVNRNGNTNPLNTCYQTITTVPGKVYKIVANILDCGIINSTNVRIDSVIVIDAVTPGTYVGVFKATATTHKIHLLPTGATTNYSTFGSVSYRELSGSKFIYGSELYSFANVGSPTASTITELDRGFSVTDLDSLTRVYVNIPTVIGKAYEASFNVPVIGTYNRVYAQNAYNGVGTNITSSVYPNNVIRFIATTTTSCLLFDSLGATTYEISNLTIRKIHENGHLYSPEKIINGTFDTDTIWSKGTGWTISGGTAQHVAGTASELLQLGKYVDGYVYEVKATVLAMSGTAATIKIGGPAGGAASLALGENKFLITAGDVAVFNALRIYIGATATITLDNISVREVYGTHTTQVTSTSRPTYSKRVNQTTQTQSYLSFALNSTSTPAPVNNVGESYDGTMTAWWMVAGTTGFNQRNYVIPASTATYKWTVRVKALTAGARVYFPVSGINSVSTLPLDSYYDFDTNTFFNSANAFPVSTPAPNGYVDLTYTFTNNNFGVTFIARITPNANTNEKVLFGGHSLVFSNQASLPYQVVTSAAVYDTDGFLQYSSFKGVDDYLVSGTGGGGTKGFFFCAAIRPTGGEKTGRMLWDDHDVNTGYLVYLSSGNLLSFYAGNGTGFTIASTAANSVAVGTDYVLTAWDDGTNLNVQINNGTIVSVARPVVAAGTAGFTIGKSNGADSNFLIADVYSQLYVKDSGLTAEERTYIYNYMAKRIGL